MEKININGLDIWIKRKKIKNIYLRIRKDSGRVEVSAPVGSSISTIEDLLEEKEGWIRQGLDRIENRTIIPRINLVNGEEIYFFGRRYYLDIEYIDRFPMSTVLQGDRIILRVKKETRQDRRLKVLKEWYRQSLEEAIEPLIKKWEGIMGVQVREWYTKDMKTRWGSCNPFYKRIWINLNLVKLPKVFLEYVLVHEMIHFFHRGHDEEFYSMMEGYIEDWEKLRDQLNRYVIL